ncbi:threonine dehydratase [Novosphingobium naphthalenivorans]|uniref:threonine dehydratase n=1 Tax=Novosphingobium naphthalenivorans TaxID=273168 RepID=UPI000AB7E0A7|nr:threonine dehydratase [Novosphingobium naphthalenivorans]
MKITRSDIEDALGIVRRSVPPTPAYAWPLLARRCGADVIVKHENHTPTGSFKARGGLVFVERLRRQGKPAGLITATRGNHGQSLAIAARAAGIPIRIVVPEGNSAEKNLAMEAFGADLVVHGRDFDEARQAAYVEASTLGYFFIPSFHRDLVCGVATYAWEFFHEHKDLDAVFVPIGMGSGICALIAVRDLMQLRTDIVGVVADQAPAFHASFQARRPILGLPATTFADGLACREPQQEALDVILRGAKDIIRVTEDEIAEAMRALFTDTHNVAEGAGAAAFAALLKERTAYAGRRVGVVLSGGNVDREVFARVLAGGVPASN